MLLHRLLRRDAQRVVLRVRDGAVPHRGEPVQVERIDDRVMRVVGASASCLVDVPTDLVWANDFASPDSCLFIVADTQSANGRLTLDYIRFVRRDAISGDLGVVLDGSRLEGVAEKFGLAATDPEAVRLRLAEELQVEGAAIPTIVVGKGADARKGFRVIGARYAVDMRRTGDNGMAVTRMVRRPPIGLEDCSLLTTTIRFVADAEAAEQAAETARQLAVLEADEESWGAIWRRYLEREQAWVRNRLENFGRWEYDDCRVDADGRAWFRIGHGPEAIDIKTSMRDRLRDLSRNDCVVAAARLPEDVEAMRSRNPLGSNKKRKRGVPGHWQLRRTEVRDRAEGGAERSTWLVADYDDEVLDSPPKSGFLFLDVRGDEARIARREKASQAIRSGRAAMRGLALLLNGQVPPGPAAAGRPPSERDVRRAFGAGSTPTDAQIAAVQYALATPDIAVIQGPPGTGKTAVIRAIAKLLDEREPRARDGGARMLITSTQHDAVENAVRKLELRNVPSLKIGRESEGGPFELWKEEWKRRLHISRRNQPAPAGDLATARRYLVPIIEGPLSRSDLIAAVERFLAAGRVAIARKSARAVERALAEATKEGVDLTAKTRTRLLPIAARLPTQLASYEDAGHLAVEHAGDEVVPVLGLGKFDAARFERLGRSGALPSSADFAALAALRRLWLIRLRLPRRPAPSLQSAPAELLAALSNAVDDWEAYEAQGTRARGSILSRLIDAIEQEPERIEQIMVNYTATLAATCQHAGSEKMLDYKPGFGGDKAIRFDSVIVDEAARVDPLDLQIPLAAAVRRIILVGDQKQLPFMLEPEIERELPKTIGEQELEALKESLFQRLADHTNSLRQSDGQRRFVMLDRCYRCHPTHVDLLSRQFYDGELKAGRAVADFAHTFTDWQDRGEPANLAWLDVPGALGRERRVGSTLARPPEAGAVAAKVEVLLAEDPTVSVGVISFYRGQVAAISEELVTAGWMRRVETDDGTNDVTYEPIWRDGDLVGKPMPRLRVGTVDSFQGLEFDVVFLSVTRSNTIKVEAEQRWPRRFGFLLSANRLCVALSRQKKLLVCVGDREFVSSGDGPKAMPALAEIAARAEKGETGVVLRT